MATSRVIFRCDASPSLGIGHVMRCLALAEVLHGRGHKIIFAMTEESAAFSRERFPKSSYRIVVLSGDPAGEPAELAAVAGPDCKLIVIDHYGRGKEFETACRSLSKMVLIWEDGAGRPHDCDVLLDTCAASAEEYKWLVPAASKILLGPRYAPLRSEFTALRPQSLARRGDGPISRVFVSFGGSDVASIIAMTLDAVAASNYDFDVDVAVLSTTPRLDELKQRADDRITVHVDAENVADIMARADLAIGAGGSTSWERCCLGLPSVVMSIAGNQLPIAAMLSKAGAAIDLGPIEPRSAERLRESVEILASDPARRTAMSIAAAHLVDGTGGVRVAEAIGL